MSTTPRFHADRRACLRAALLTLGMAHAGSARASGPTLWLISPDQTGPYAEALAAVRSALPGSTLRSLSPSQLPDLTKEAAPTLVLTLGSAGLATALTQAASSAALADVPVLAGLLPRASYEAQIEASAQARRTPLVTSAVWLDPAVVRHLDLIRAALPQVRRVGVLWGPASQRWRPMLQRDAAERGLKLVEAEPKDAELFPALSEVLEDAEVFLALPDNTLFTPASLNNMLIAAYRRRVPVLGYAATHVRAGALLALYATPHQAGRELAELANRVLAQRRVPPPAPARLWSVGHNEQVARSLGLVLPDAAQLLQQLKRAEGHR